MNPDITRQTATGEPDPSKVPVIEVRQESDVPPLDRKPFRVPMGYDDGRAPPDVVHLAAERYDRLPEIPVIRHPLLHGGIARLDPGQIRHKGITLVIRQELAVIDINGFVGSLVAATKASNIELINTFESGE